LREGIPPLAAKASQVTHGGQSLFLTGKRLLASGRRLAGDEVTL